MKKHAKIGLHNFYRPHKWGDGSDTPQPTAAPNPMPRTNDAKRLEMTDDAMQIPLDPGCGCKEESPAFQQTVPQTARYFDSGVTFLSAVRSENRFVRYASRVVDIQQ